MADSPRLVLEQSSEAAALAPVLSTVLQAELDRRLASIHAGFAAERAQGEETLARDLRLWSATHLRKGDGERVLEVANRIRSLAKAVLVVGIGGSDLGGRVIHELLDAVNHNDLPEARRGGAPKLYFAGNTFDPKPLLGILDSLDIDGLLAETVVVVISKSGTTGETIGAALIVAEAMKAKGIDWRSRFVAVTGPNEKSVLYRMNEQQPFLGMLPIHDGVGGRFSVHTEVGLLPALVTASDPAGRLADAMAGVQAADDLFFLPPASPDNLAYRLAEQLHLHEVWGRRSSVVFYNYASDASLGAWFTQLLSESIQERGSGLDVISVIGPTGNHSILNGLIRGPRNKFILFLAWDDLGPDLMIPGDTGIGGEMEAFERLGMSRVQAASLAGTQQDVTANGVPNVTLRVARRDTVNLFCLFRVLMDAIAVKGKLQCLDVSDDGAIDPTQELTYLQHGVEGYKQRTREAAKAMHTG